MSYYVLSEDDIKNILKDGKFNKGDYAGKQLVGYWNAEDIVETYEQCFALEEDKEKWDEIYKEKEEKILTKIAEDYYLDDYGCEYIESEMESQFMDLALGLISKKEVL